MLETQMQPAIKKPWFDWRSATLLVGTLTAAFLPTVLSSPSWGDSTAMTRAGWVLSSPFQAVMRSGLGWLMLVCLAAMVGGIMKLSGHSESLWNGFAVHTLQQRVLLLMLLGNLALDFIPEVPYSDVILAVSFIAAAVWGVLTQWGWEGSVRELVLFLAVSHLWSLLFPYDLVDGSTGFLFSRHLNSFEFLLIGAGLAGLAYEIYRVVQKQSEVHTAR